MNRRPFDMFFYGTLKRGQRNHSYCHGALTVRYATVQGSLYDLPAGYPALVVYDQDILAVGTADHLRDAGQSSRRSHPPERPPLEQPVVFGELYTFNDAEERLPALDRLEGFVPQDPSSPYRRVLIPARTDDGHATLAWSYVAKRPAGRHLPDGRWPGLTR